MIFRSVQFDVPAPVTLRRGVGDVLPVGTPLDAIAVPLHQLQEMLPAPRHGHAVINDDFQIHLPALPFVVSPVLPGGHGVFFLLGLRLYNRKTILHAQFIRCFAQLHQAFLVAVVFLSAFTADGVDDEVGMDVIPVGVGRHYDFKAGDLLRQFQRNLMGHLRRHRIVGMEGLDHVIVHPPAGAAVLMLGVHELLQGDLWHTVDAGDQTAALAFRFGFPAAVIDDALQTAHGLGAFAFCKADDRHYVHRFLVRMSESNELT